jgi:DNA-binding CsgD family transcriptional regulator
MARHEVLCRERELAAIAAFLAAAEERPAGLTLDGEPGIGKTTLFEHAVGDAKARGYRVLAARPTSAESALSFVGLTDLLAGVHEVFLELPSPQRKALEVALLVQEAVDVPADPRAIALGLLGVLRALAAASPVVVAVDDLQWLDRPSAAALSFALRRLTAEPVGMLAALRSGSAPAVAEPVRSMAGEKVLLGPLTVGAVHALLADRLALSIPRSLLVRVHEASGGNPLFALEIGRVIQESGLPEPGQPFHVPSELQTFFAARLEQLPAETLDALAIAAATAAPTRALVRAEALEPAVRAEVVQLEGERIHFRHPLLASAVYTRLDPGVRRKLHRRMATAVTDPEERARHLALAVEGPDPDVAATLEEAANHARARGAWEAAADLAEQALLRTPVGQMDDVWRRTFAAADRKRDAGDLRRAMELLEQVVRTQPPRKIRSRAHHLLGLTRWFVGDHERGLAQIELASAEADDDAARARIERDIGMLLVANWHPRRAEPHVRTALELSERLDDPSLLARTLPAAAMLEFVYGRGTRFDLLERALEFEAFVRGERTALSPTWWLATILSEIGNLDGARPLLQDLLGRTMEVGDMTYYPEFAARLAGLELRAGDHDRAAEQIKDAIDVARQIESEILGETLTVQASIQAHRGDVDAARETLGEATSVCDRFLPIFAAACANVAAFIAASVGDPEEILEAVDGIYDRLRGCGVGEPMLFRFLPDQIEALVAVDRVSQARLLLDWLEERGRVLDRPWALATSGRCRALVCAAEGDFGAALASIESALNAHQRVPMPYELGRTLLVKGTIERRAGRRRDARESLERAVDIFERLDAPLWTEKARTELARIGGRTPAGHELTGAEECVARLVANGKTNREVAAALFVTVRTVETHLSSIYRKLGLRSRSELTRRLAAG